MLRATRAAIPLALALAQACIATTGGARTSPAVARADSAARAAIASERQIDASRFPPRSVGVAPLVVESSDTSLRVLGYGLADLLTTDLAKSGDLQVVERVQMDALLRELGLAASGRVDSSVGPRLGRLVGARRLITGAVLQLSDARLSLQTRIADVGSGAVTNAAAATPSLDAILDAEKALAFELFDRLGANLTPAERSNVEQRPTRSIAALLAYSRGVRQETLGDFAGAARAYGEAARIDPTFNQAQQRESQAQQNISEAAPLPTAEDPLKRALTLAADPINRPSLPAKSDAADPSFRGSTQKLVTLIIPIVIP